MKRSYFEKPIYSSAINDVSVRFFAPPDRRPAFAWVAVADALLASRFPEPINPDFLLDLRRDAADDTLTISTPDGAETIAAFWLARAMFDGAVLVGATTQEVVETFLAETAVATVAVMGPLSRARIQHFLDLAADRHEAATLGFLA